MYMFNVLCLVLKTRQYASPTARDVSVCVSHLLLLKHVNVFCQSQLAQQLWKVIVQLGVGARGPTSPRAAHRGHRLKMVPAVLAALTCRREERRDGEAYNVFLTLQHRQ